jgi:hypothetical protein
LYEQIQAKPNKNNAQTNYQRANKQTNKRTTSNKIEEKKMKQIELSPCPTSRSGHKAIVFGKSMFIIGGSAQDLEVFGFDFGKKIERKKTPHKNY